MKPRKPVTIRVGQTFFTHRYKYRHDARRIRAKRLLKRGKITLVNSTEDGWCYRALEEVTIP